MGIKIACEDAVFDLFDLWMEWKTEILKNKVTHINDS